jgi:hypothetical protein
MQLPIGGCSRRFNDCGGTVDKKRNSRRPFAASANGRKPKSGAGAAGGGGDGETFFNEWLETRLRSAYSSVLDEPIPEDLIRLINEKLRD